MSLRQRGPNTWQIKVYTGVDASGRENKPATATFHGTKSEARKEELRMKARVGAMPRGAASQSITLGEMFERWIAVYVEPSAIPPSVASYRRLFKHVFSERLGSVKLQELTPEHIQRALNDAAAAGYSRASLVKARYLVSGPLRRARLSGLVTTNAAEDTKVPKAPAMKHVRSLTPEELRRFVDAAMRLQIYGPVLATAALTGMRRAELLCLTWDNVDFENGIIKVREGGFAPGTTKSAAGQRDVEMSATLHLMLAEMHGWDLSRRAFTPTWNPGRYVFPNSHGGKLNQMTSFAKPIKKAMQAAGVDLPGFRLHDLRHSHGSLLNSAGISIADVAARLGHSPETAVRIYLHSDGARCSRMKKCLDELTDGTSPDEGEKLV